LSASKNKIRFLYRVSAGPYYLQIKLVTSKFTSCCIDHPKWRAQFCVELLWQSEVSKHRT